MKYIILFLFATLTHAECQIRTFSSVETGNGYVIACVSDGKITCLGMPDIVDLTIIPATWMTFASAKDLYNWGNGDEELRAACLTAIFPRTLSNTLYHLQPNGVLETSPVPVPGGTVCGDRCGESYGGIGWRSMTINGVTGLGVCR